MSDSQELPPESVSSFIDKVLKAKDPATVGLKKILKKHNDEQNDFPLRSGLLEEFYVDGSSTKKLSEDERHILKLEKRIAELQVALRQQNERSVTAIQAAYTKGKKEGCESGRKDGIKTATETYEKKIDILQKRIEEMLMNMETSKKMMFHNSEHILLHLCIEIARKIIGREVSEQHDTVLQVLKKALTFIGHHEKMVIRVAARDLETVSGRKDFWMPVGERLNDITIESDDQVKPGGCILETNSGMVDARLGIQLQEVNDLVERTWNEIHSAIVAGSKNGTEESPDD